MKIEEFNPEEMLFEGSGYEPIESPVFDSEQMYAEKNKFASLRNKDAVKMLKAFAPAIVGFVLVLFGLMSTGSYFDISHRESGIVAVLWYNYQVGTFIAIAGSIAIYDTIKRNGYL